MWSAGWLCYNGAVLRIPSAYDARTPRSKSCQLSVRLKSPLCTPRSVCVESAVCGPECAPNLVRLLAGEHEHTIVGYSLVKGIGDGEPIASERFNVGGHEWVRHYAYCLLSRVQRNLRLLPY